MNHIFSKRKLAKVEVLEHFVVSRWVVSETSRRMHYDETFVMDFSPNFIATAINSVTAPHGLRALAINSSHSFGKWYIAVKIACEQNQYGLNETKIERLNSIIRSPMMGSHDDWKKVAKFLNDWSKLPGLPAELIPPITELDRSHFALLSYW